MAIGSSVCAACPVMPSPTRMRGVGPVARAAADRRAEHELAVRGVELVDEAGVGLERRGDRRRDALQHLVELERRRGRGDDVREQAPGGGQRFPRLHGKPSRRVHVRAAASAAIAADAGTVSVPAIAMSPATPQRTDPGRRADPAPTMAARDHVRGRDRQSDARGRQQDTGCGCLRGESLRRLEREDALPERTHDPPAAREGSEGDRRRGRQDHPGREPRSCRCGRRRRARAR